MNARSLLFVGLTLLGVHQILQALLGLPNVLALAQQASQAPPFANDQAIGTMVFTLLGLVLLCFVGIVLFVNAPPFATRLAGRLAASASEAARGLAEPPPMPRTEDE